MTHTFVSLSEFASRQRSETLRAPVLDINFVNHIAPQEHVFFTFLPPRAWQSLDKYLARQAKVNRLRGPTPT
jgi:hypothetical protein